MQTALEPVPSGATSNNALDKTPTPNETLLSEISPLHQDSTLLGSGISAADQMASSAPANTSTNSFSLGPAPPRATHSSLKSPRSHSRHSSVSSVASSDLDSTGGGPQKRTTLARKARAESSPYPRDPSLHYAQGEDDMTAEEEIAELLANSGVSGGGRGDGGHSSGSSIDARAGWGHSRGSSMSSNGWSTYDPHGALVGGGGDGSLSANESESRLDLTELLPPARDSAGVKIAHAGRDEAAARRALELSAAQTREAASTNAQDKARGLFVHTWLGESYALCQDGNVSRQGLYGSHLRACSMYGVKPINSASFGKAVRAKFVNIKTRRLGVRGNSRYHYCGIQPAHATEAALLAQLDTEEPHSDEKADYSPNEGSVGQPHTYFPPSGDYQTSYLQPATPTTARPTPGSIAGKYATSVLHGRNGGGSDHVPRFPSLEEALHSANGTLDAQKAREFWGFFTQHCDGLLDAVRANRFDQFELNVRSWWGNLNPMQKDLAQHPAMSTLIYRADAATYDSILEHLHSQILVNMPPHAFVTLRALGDNMEKIQTLALSGFEGQPFTGPKIELAARVGHLITRHLGLCQLAQALIGVVANPNNLKEMAEAWDSTDFEAIKNQSALVSNCEHDLLTECFESFKVVLQIPGRSPIENIIAWADECFQRCRSPRNGQAPIPPRSLLVRWSFVTSQIMRDLTLRSAPSFGSFQIVSLFFDELLGFQVLRQVALQISAITTSVSPPNAYDISPTLQTGNAAYSMGTGPPASQHQTVSYNPAMMDPKLGFGTFEQFSPATREVFETVLNQGVGTPGPAGGAGGAPGGAPGSGYNFLPQLSFEPMAYDNMDVFSAGGGAGAGPSMTGAEHQQQQQQQMDMGSRFGELVGSSPP